MSNAEDLQNQNRELLALMSATLWVLEHPDVNAIKFCGNPMDLARRIRLRMDQCGMGANDSALAAQEGELTWQ